MPQSKAGLTKCLPKIDRFPSLHVLPTELNWSRYARNRSLSYSEQPHPRLGSTRPLPQPQVCDGTGSESPSDTYGLVAGLSSLPGTAASAALKPLREWVPSQKGLVVEPPQRHRANGRFGIA